MSKPGPSDSPLRARVLGMPKIAPMLAGVARGPFGAPGWLFEVKWDGYRCLAYIASGGIYLDSRNGKPLLPKFPALSSVQSALKADQALLDGEIVAFRGGRADFSYLRRGPRSVMLVVFDILWLDGESLMGTPLKERRRMLREALAWDGGHPLALSEVVEGRGKDLYDWACQRDLEGIMAKKADSLYFPGRRSDDWLKIKNVREGKFWVVGYAPSPGRALGSLVLAQREGGAYAIVGRVSSGLDSEHERRLLGILEPLPGSKPPDDIKSLPPKSEVRQVRWVVPFYGVEVSYTEMTPDGRLRHPVFKEVTGPDAQ